MIDSTQLWTVILGLGAGSFALRFSFLGIIGKRPLPEWVLRHLRYTAVAVLPGLIAPLVLWPAATGGELEPARLCAAAATLLIGITTRNVLAAIFGGAITLYGMMYLLA
ncbi:AzlD domain-containing protein [Cognatishimia sp. MH4019]|uniref:AzlD domain-containing protein n=1 Tax=Cognatishimia sp. MH4019 TaxID=2854030 RepID=UPI001CD2E991|nr:AzlD domain-containing protein [Cognatishimia sp. MH4019]